MVDPTGMEAKSPIYGLDGKYLGNDNMGFAGELIFMEEDTYNRLTTFKDKDTSTDGSAHKNALDHGTALAFGITLNQITDTGIPTQEQVEMVNNAITHVVSQSFDVSTLSNGKTSSDYTRPHDGQKVYRKEANGGIMPKMGQDEYPAMTRRNIVSFNLYSSIWTLEGEFTVSNIQNDAAHEFDHFFNGTTGEGPGHAKAFEVQMCQDFN